MAGMGYRKKSATRLFSLLTVLGGGLPGRPGFETIQGARYFGKSFAVEGLLIEIQFVEIVKFTVILACVSTGSAPM